MPKELDQRETRLVTILPGRWNDCIQCVLNYHQLDQAPKAPYKALSYVWGSPYITEAIEVHSRNQNVTINLACAIRHLRDTKRPIVIWIDALCIDQNNITEKNHQVTLMRDIYAGAEEVILFLGDGVNHRISTAYLTQPLPSPVVFWNDSRDDSHLQLFRDSSKALWKQKSWNAFYLICLIRILSQEGDFSFAKAAIEAVNGQRRRELFELLRRLAVEPWWHRIWVVQEVAISPKVTVRYGNVTAPWDMFVQVAENTQSHDYSLTLEAEYAKVLSLFTRQVLDIENLRGEWEANKGTDLLSLLQRFSDRKATDERDKVYALLGLARRHQFLVPDYSTSIDNLYQSTAITLIGSYGNLAPLSGDLKRKNSRSLASWIPDWSAIFDKSDRERMVLYRTYHACSNWRITVFEPPEKYLNYVAREMGRLVTSP